MGAVNNLIITIIIFNIIYFILDSIIPDGDKKDIYKGMINIIITCVISMQTITILQNVFGGELLFTSLFDSQNEYVNLSFGEYFEKYKEILLPYLE